jgi:hypothetical protein
LSCEHRAASKAGAAHRFCRHGVFRSC